MKWVRRPTQTLHPPVCVGWFLSGRRLAPGSMNRRRGGSRGRAQRTTLRWRRRTEKGAFFFSPPKSYGCNCERLSGVLITNEGREQAACHFKKNKWWIQIGLYDTYFPQIRKKKRKKKKHCSKKKKSLLCLMTSLPLLVYFGWHLRKLAGRQARREAIRGKRKMEICGQVRSNSMGFLSADCSELIFFNQRQETGGHFFF